MLCRFIFRLQEEGQGHSMYICRQGQAKGKGKQIVVRGNVKHSSRLRMKMCKWSVQKIAVQNSVKSAIFIIISGYCALSVFIEGGDQIKQKHQKFDQQAASSWMVTYFILQKLCATTSGGETNFSCFFFSFLRQITS